MKMRYLKLTAAVLLGTTAVAAATDTRDLPSLVEYWQAEGDRAGDLARRADLVRCQGLATDDLVGRLADGRLSLADAVEQLETNTQSRPAFREAVAAVRPDGTVRDQLAGYLVSRVAERVGNDPGRLSQLEAEARAVAAAK